MQSYWVMQERMRPWLERIVLFGLAAFSAASMLPIPGKALNNIAYVLILLPSLLLLLGRRDGFSFVYRRSAPLLFFVLAVVLAALVQGSDGFVKEALLVFLLTVGLAFLLEKSTERAAGFYGVFAVVAVLALLVASYDWLKTVLETGTFVRQVSFGTAKNPIYAGLLSVSALVFVWLFLIERHPGRMTALRWAGGLLVVGLVMLAVVVFQARSALVGFAVFLIFYAAMLNGFRYMVAALVLGALALLGLGAHEAILVRGLSYRPEIWADAIAQVYRDCGLIAGCGKTDELFVGQFWGSHSGYVGTFYRHGVLGAAAFLVFACWYFMNGWRARSRWFLVSLIGWGGMLSAMDGFVGAPHAWWVFFWLPTLAAIAEFQHVRSRPSSI